MESSTSVGIGGSLSFRSQFSKRWSSERQTDHSFGLTILYTPQKALSVDIVFVHGLGGGSQRIWTSKSQPHLFWPQELLPDEPEINTARILTFGYYSDFRSTGPNNVSSISDFARQLLNAMKYGKGGDDLNIGKVFTSNRKLLLFRLNLSETYNLRCTFHGRPCLEKGIWLPFNLIFILFSCVCGDLTSHRIILRIIFKIASSITSFESIFCLTAFLINF